MLKKKGLKNNLGIIFHISALKHILQRDHKIYVSFEK